MNEEGQSMAQGTDVPAEPAIAAETVPRASRLAWLREGARVLALRAPRWQGLDAGPATLLVLMAVAYAAMCGVQWALMEGSPKFVWRGAMSGWAAFALLLWLCWVVVRSARVPVASLARLVALLCAAGLVFSVVVLATHLAAKAVFGVLSAWPLGWQWALWLAPLVWIGSVKARLLWRMAGSVAARVAIVLLVPAHLALGAWFAPVVFWWAPPAEEAQEAADVYKGLPLNEDTVTGQPQLLADHLSQLRKPAPGRVNVYAVTFAPYASEDVFMRESAVVAKAMRERFGADGRVVELVNNPATARRLPWAMPTHLHKAIQHMASVMDRDRDVLFLHLTSHGGADGVLAANSWPLETGVMTPQLLKHWLDEAGIKWRVISVSACYSGSWIEPLAGDGTLVMTAADADHTSYGCGRRSPLTFFGQAMYVDALYETRSFTAAHAKARLLIDEREKVAGKKDGYSNPQIRVGAGIEPVLKRLAEEQGG